MQVKPKSSHQRWIYIYAAFALVATFWFYLHLAFKIQLVLLAPGVISLAYVFPVLKGRKRIRDLHFIKIFLIAIVWAWITVFIPALLLEVHYQGFIYLMFLERVLFIFAITLPFDIRDLLLDEEQAVKTLPSILGITATRRLAAIVLSILVLLVSTNLYLGNYSIEQSIGIFISVIIAYALIYFANPAKPDYYFTAYLDGTMVLQFGLVFLFTGGFY